MIKKVYIILINYNGYLDTLECLNSLKHLNYNNYQIIIVDNNSSDNSIENIKASINKDYILYSKNEAIIGGTNKKENLFHNPIVLIDAKENNGFAAGNNIALKYIFSKNDFEYIWLLNNDTVVDNNALLELVLGIEKYNNIGAVGSKILYYDRKNLLQNVGTKIDNTSFFKHCKPIINLKKDNIDNGQYDYDFEVNDIMGASLLIKKEVLEIIGFMPEEYFLYGEETDWNFNIQENGYKLMTIYKSEIYHKKSKSTGGDFSNLTLYYRTRNQFLLNKKYMNFIKYIIFIIFYSLKKIVYAFTLKKEKRRVIFKALYHGFLQKFGKRNNELI